jgi:hypothetical protein
VCISTAFAVFGGGNANDIGARAPVGIRFTVSPDLQSSSQARAPSIGPAEARSSSIVGSSSFSLSDVYGGGGLLRLLVEFESEGGLGDPADGISLSLSASLPLIEPSLPLIEPLSRSHVSTRPLTLPRLLILICARSRYLCAEESETEFERFRVIAGDGGSSPSVPMKANGGRIKSSDEIDDL